MALLQTKMTGAVDGFGGDLGEKTPGGHSASTSRERTGWSLDEYVVVGDLYLSRGRSSGIRDPEVLKLAAITGRSPAAISRRLGNFDGTVRPGKGLKPVIGEPLKVFNRMRHDFAYRRDAVSEATIRLEQSTRTESETSRSSVTLVDPEECVVEESLVTPPPVTRRMVRTEAKLVRRYRKWLDPTGVRLRGLVVETGHGNLRADLFDVRCNLLIEAKAEASRENIRYAIGQLLDYRRYIDPSPDMAVLLPSPPTEDLIGLLTIAGISAIWESGESFDGLPSAPAPVEVDEHS